MRSAANIVADRLLAGLTHMRECVMYARHPNAPWSMEFLRRVGRL